jgi:hypothetical protein
MGGAGPSDARDFGAFPAGAVYRQGTDPAAPLPETSSVRDWGDRWPTGHRAGDVISTLLHREVDHEAEPVNHVVLVGGHPQ